MKHKKTALIASGALVVIVGGCSAAVIAGSSGQGIKTSPPAATHSASAAPAATHAVQPGSTPAGPLTGPVGTTYTVTGGNGVNGTQTTYEVTLTGVEQAARLAPYGSLTNDADHMAAASFAITGKTGETSDDANNDAVAVGSNGQDYDFSASSVTAGINFSYGNYTAGPGETTKGVVAFELPEGVTIKAIKWSPGFEGPTASWTAK
jgi:hypothetical protein